MKGFEKFSRRIFVISVVMQRACARLHQARGADKRRRSRSAERGRGFRPSMTEQKSIKSAERRRVDVGKRTECNDIYKGKTVS